MAEKCLKVAAVEKKLNTYHREIERRWRKSVNKVPNGTSGRVLGKRDTENDAGNHQNIAIQNKISICYRFLFFSVENNNFSPRNSNEKSMKINKCH